jgi:hypothetical protein
MTPDPRQTGPPQTLCHDPCTTWRLGTPERHLMLGRLQCEGHTQAPPGAWVLTKGLNGYGSPTATWCTPNLGLGHASTPTPKLGWTRPRPTPSWAEVGMDASTPNSKLGLDASTPNFGLGHTAMPTAKVGVEATTPNPKMGLESGSISAQPYVLI